ncbi:hypothetical protein F5X96DRAFT_679383 [Biscogniauxia mediterranea]|nr:hypothetical protein F5X96DRAFT_679383 [Biscogniauxia mediterranea]
MGLRVRDDTGSSEASMDEQLRLYQETLVPNMIACISVCNVASLIFVALRIRSRQIMYGRLKLETNDWLLLIAWLFEILFAVCFGFTTAYGSGRHAFAVSNRHLLQIFSILTECFYFPSMLFIKLSILSLYASIFPVKRFHWWLKAVAVFMGAWALQGVFVTIFQCVPVEYGWNREIPGGYCINYGASTIVTIVCNILTDFVVLLMPIPLVSKLQVSRQKKRLIMLTFALGGSACIVSIIRLPYAIDLGNFDGSWTAVPAAMIGAVELMAGILAVSMPTYRPLYYQLFKRTEVPKLYKGPDGSYKGSYSINNGRIYTNNLPHTVSVSVDTSSGDPAPGINITDQIELIRHTHKNGVWVRVPDNSEVGILFLPFLQC